MTTFDTPVVLCVYNRPELTRRVLDALRKVRPSRLLIVADGPKEEVPADWSRCKDVQEVLRTIDWDVHVDMNAAPTNLGCRKRLQTGLSWVFDRVGEAIIVEDDCIPAASFFEFCRTLLDRYRNDPRIGIICGTNFQFHERSAATSYFFSRYPLLWGWAAWRRSWDIYDADLDAWEALRDTSWLTSILSDPLSVGYWREVFDRVRAGMDTWDYSMVFSCWLAGALSIHPCHNLVTNIGFGGDSTHTRDARSIFSNMATRDLAFPLVHPDAVERDAECDAQTERVAFSGTAKARLRAAMMQLRAQRKAGEGSP